MHIFFSIIYFQSNVRFLPMTTTYGFSVSNIEKINIPQNTVEVIVVIIL